MNDKQVVNTLLAKEGEIINKFHNAVNDILRLGCNTERGQRVITDLVSSVQYSLEEVERIIDVGNSTKENSECMNYVIANKTDEQVTKGEKYPILSMHDGMVNIDVHGTMICFNAEDKDFTVHLNANASDETAVWKYKSGKHILTCSSCGIVKPYEISQDNPDVLLYWDCKYCPNCGKLMREEYDN